MVTILPQGTYVCIHTMVIALMMTFECQLLNKIITDMNCMNEGLSRDTKKLTNYGHMGLQIFPMRMPTMEEYIHYIGPLVWQLNMLSKVHTVPQR